MRNGTKDSVTAKVPLEYCIFKVAEAWGMHPAKVDPRGQRPRDARWFWWQLEIMELEAKFAR